ncbi:unnamed protein product [Rotaria sordida]|uniref:C2H2-type domain-containing protein n=1 Tax=Rotaria sordida TaxID=392033 RepID=A0A813Q661_9BILA|nr:unnamed protein product [Rotaria sordida]CAF0762484.1 unnamed protein product [Rotaria sordida]
MSSYYESLFSSNQQTNSNLVLLSSLFYPLPSSLFQLDSSFRLYHEVFFRNLFDQYFQAPSPPPLLLTPPTIIPTVSIEKESHASLTTENCLRKNSSSISSLNSKVRRRLSCPQCSYTTNRLNNLKRHIQTMHEILSEPIDCCNQLFTSKAHFRAHVNTEHRCGYHCDTCRRTFCRKALLRRHQSIHSGQKTFFCPICSYSTSHKGNLDRHIRIHRHQNEHKNLLV